MSGGILFSQNQKTRALFLELVRMWQRAGKSRAGAIDQTSKDLGIAARKGKRIVYDEPHVLSLREELSAESRAEDAWLRIADEARQTAEYCAAQAELSRIRKRQGELFGGVGWSKHTHCSRNSQTPAAKPRTDGRSLGARSAPFGIGLSVLLYAAAFGKLCAGLIG